MPQQAPQPVWTPYGWQCLVWTPHGWQWALWTAQGWQLPPPLWSPGRPPPDPRLRRNHPAPHGEPTPYHLLLRTPRARRWHPLLGLAMVVAVLMASGVAVFGGAALAVELIDDPSIASETDLDELTGPLGLLLGNLMIAALIPATVLAVLVVHGERPGWLTSVTRRLRPRLLLTSGAIALGVQVAAFGGDLGLSAAGVELDFTDGDAEWPGARTFLALLLIITLTTPVQAAGEEYLFRGYLIQGAGVWTRSPWVPGIVSSLLFAAAHGPQDPWLFSDRLAFGLIAWAVTMRTGGLEAAIALHAVNNLVVLIGAAATDEIDSSLTATDVGAAMALFDIAVLAVSGYLLDRNARRLGAATHTDPAAS